MRRAVRMTIRLVAAGIVVIGALYVGLEYVRHRMQGAEVSPWRVAIGTFGVVLGVGLFAASSPLAKRMTEDFEE